MGYKENTHIDNMFYIPYNTYIKYGIYILDSTGFELRLFFVFIHK